MAKDLKGHEAGEGKLPRLPSSVFGNGPETRDKDSINTNAFGEGYSEGKVFVRASSQRLRHVKKQTTCDASVAYRVGRRRAWD